MNRHNLIAQLREYHSRYSAEQDFVALFIALLEKPRAYYRDHLPGHVTGSAWIVDETSTKVLLTHHAKLNRWLQPGGHADGNENIYEVALKEACEETGIQNFTFLHEGIFDLDIHTIPARNDFPEHLHYDVRFLLAANRETDLIITTESLDLQWIDLNSIAAQSNQNESMIRMANKTTWLSGTNQ